MTLAARTQRLDHDVDLLAFAGDDGVLFERGRVGLAGRGIAGSLDWPAGDPRAAAPGVAAGLADVTVLEDEVDRPGTGAVAFGALPFVPGAGAQLVVPALVVGRGDDGTRWLTTVGPADDPRHHASPGELLAAVPPVEPLPPPRTITVQSIVEPDDWCELVERATKVLAGASGPDDLRKVVLAREVHVQGDRPFDRVALLDRLRTTFPGCHIVAVGRLVCASPELLVSRSGEMVRSHPMAGTAPRGGDPTTDQRLAASLLASTKDRAEHQITIDMVHDTLLPWCSYLDYEAEPSVVPVANVQHLATLVEGRLSQPPPSVLELVAALHPTPAVSGSPRDAAVAWIGANEGFDRGLYAGTAGWTDGRGNGTWAVAVRAAELDGDAVRVIAGNGIVADSDPETELAETRVKLQALLTALVRP
ncbi:MAG TPA: isochorismate synthase [Acidimicrobiales bacterium]